MMLDANICLYMWVRVYACVFACTTQVLTDNYEPDWSTNSIAITTSATTPAELRSAHILINCRDHDYVRMHDSYC